MKMNIFQGHYDESHNNTMSPNNKPKLVSGSCLVQSYNYKVIVTKATKNYDKINMLKKMNDNREKLRRLSELFCNDSLEESACISWSKQRKEIV